MVIATFTCSHQLGPPMQHACVVASYGRADIEMVSSECVSATFLPVSVMCIPVLWQTLFASLAG